MNERTLNILEWGKVKELLKARTSSLMTRELIDDSNISKDMEEVKLLQKQTSDALNLMTRKGNPPFTGLRDVLNFAISKVEKNIILSGKELLAVAGMLKCARDLKRYYVDDGNKVDTSLNDFFYIIKPMKQLEDEINRCIIDEEEIADDASPELKRIRREISNANSKIKDHLNGIIKSSSYQKFLQENIVTMRDGRYVIPVKQEYRSELPGIVHYQSATGSTLFVEPMAVVNENNNLRTLKLEEQEEIQRILAFLTAMVSENIEDIKVNLDMCIQLDFIFARGKLSIDMDGSEPRINDIGRIRLYKARHPLIEKEKVVPIDVLLGEKFNILVITGPNTGGKTVSLKTMGLFCVMAQFGLHIPASDESEIGIFDKIYADIGDEQSIEQSLSTFSAHMKNLIYILKNVDRKTLVLLDEVGSGTDPVEGSAIAMSVLEFLRQKGSRVLATTHYSQLKTYAISTENVENACCEFSVETLSPTYRLLIGIPGKSNAFAISKRLGLNDEILDMARKYISEENIRFEDVISDLEYNKRISEEEKRKAQRLTEEVERLKKEMEDKAGKINLEREKIIEKANIEAARILSEAKNVADESIKSIKKLSKEMTEEKRLQDAENEKNRISKGLDKVQEEVIKSFKGKNKKAARAKKLEVGDDVMILSLGQKGIIVDIKDENSVLVQAGIMKITVGMSNLEPIEENAGKKSRNKNVIDFASSKVKTVNARLDIRGTRVDEALEEVDKYLDDCCIAGLQQVTIVHGKGTGALRAAIHDQLKKHPHVKNFRIGEYGEGDSGITVIEIK